MELGSGSQGLASVLDLEGRTQQQHGHWDNRVQQKLGPSGQSAIVP